MSVSITITIPGPDAPKLKKRLWEEAQRRGWSLSEYCVEALAHYMRDKMADKVGGSD